MAIRNRKSNVRQKNWHPRLDCSPMASSTKQSFITCGCKWTFLTVDFAFSVSGRVAVESSKGISSNLWKERLAAIRYCLARSLIAPWFTISVRSFGTALGILLRVLETSNSIMEAATTSSGFDSSWLNLTQALESLYSVFRLTNCQIELKRQRQPSNVSPQQHIWLFGKQLLLFAPVGVKSHSFSSIILCRLNLLTLLFHSVGIPANGKAPDSHLLQKRLLENIPLRLADRREVKSFESGWVDLRRKRSQTPLSLSIPLSTVYL